MKTMRCGLVLAVGLVLLCGAAAPATAQDDGSATFSGLFRIGYRAVDVSGAETKYKEDFNYDDGPRLFDLSFTFLPEPSLRRLVDRIDLTATNLGGDPYETMHLGVRKYGAFDFRYDRFKDDYFYQDVILPVELEDIRASTGGDFHHFDFQRVRENAALKIDVGPRAVFDFGFNRYTRQGSSTTTLDLQRDEFELDKPLDESLNAYHAGVEYRFDKVTLGVEERVRDFTNVVEIFLPGASPGATTTNASQLDYFFLDQPYDYTSHEHVLRATARPTDRWILTGRASLTNLDLDVHASESSGGTNPQGQPFTEQLAGGGDISRDADQFDFDATFMVTDRLAVVGSAYQKSLDQDGRFTFGGEPGTGHWKIDTSGLSAAVQYVITTALTGTAGVRWESRDVDHRILEPGADDEESTSETTDHTGLFGVLAWHPAASPLRVTAEIDSSSFDDPYTLASPSDRLRYHVKADYKLTGGFSLNASYLGHTTKNDDADFDAHYDQANLRLAYTAAGLDASVGYGYVDISRRVEHPIDFLSLTPYEYEAQSDFFDGRLRWQATPEWGLGGSFTFYQNDGSFGLSRDDVQVYGEYTFPQRTSLRLGYRNVDYNEDAYSFDDYSADIVEASIGYRW